MAKEFRIKMKGPKQDNGRPEKRKSQQSLTGPGWTRDIVEQLRGRVRSYDVVKEEEARLDDD